MARLKDSAKQPPRKAPGLNARHRDRDGEIRLKNGDTRIETLRRTYGDEFASGYRGDTKLSTVLEQSGANSLSDLLLNRSDARISDSSRAIFERAEKTYRNALKRLANK